MGNEKNIVEEAIEEAKASVQEAEDVEAETESEVEEVAEETKDATAEVEEADQESEEVTQESEEASEESKGLFKKKKKEKKKDPKDEKIEELTDRVTRQMAEFDNFRKRTEKEKSMMYEIGAKDIIEKILPVVDNFERGLQAVPEEDKENPFVDGMDKVYKQLMTTLEGIDVKPIEAVGATFDPELHNAVMHIEDEEVGENVIVEEFQKGYTYREQVVRFSMVKVAN